MKALETNLGAKSSPIRINQTIAKTHNVGGAYRSPMRDVTNNASGLKQALFGTCSKDYVEKSPSRIIPSSQLSELTNEELSSSPLPVALIKEDPDQNNMLTAFETQQPGLASESLDLNDDGPRLLVEDEEAETLVITSPTPKRPRTGLYLHSGDFNKEIDEDLKSGKRHTTFPKPAQLPTPLASGGSRNHTIESWLKANAGLRDQTSQTPTRKQFKPSKLANNEVMPKFETYADFYDHVTKLSWQKVDFQSNPESDERVASTFKNSMKLKKFRCTHGPSCKDCTRFFELAGDVANFDPANIRSGRKNTLFKADTWERPESPPGFWRADFPSTQEEQEDSVARREQKALQVQERLLEALQPKGRFMFKDMRYRNELQRLTST